MQEDNHIFISESLNKAIAYAKRHNTTFAILILHLDSIPGIEYAFIEIETRLSCVLRSEDSFARLEANEFIILLSDIGKPKFASAVAEKILQTCSAPFKINSKEISLRSNVGICVYPNDGDSLETLLSHLYMALNTAIRAGNGQYQFYSAEIDKEARQYIQLGGALRKAIQNNELILHYQPRHHLKRGCVTGIESLIRWTHPELGVINPSVFIPLAEETNLIIPIGKWAMLEACKTNKHWQDEGYHHFTMGVNVSFKQFYHPDFVEMITSVLNETGLNPNYLELEIGEMTVMNNIELAASILNKIKALGVQIAIDHFGVGSTAISHLKHFPINVIKIDQSYIKGIPNNTDDMAITNAFISLGHHLGFEVVAEGVETAEQVQYLTEQKCDMVQGYYFSHPLPADKLIQEFKKITEDAII